jgi:hypothetical protein
VSAGPSQGRDALRENQCCAAAGQRRNGTRSRERSAGAASRGASFSDYQGMLWLGYLGEYTYLMTGCPLDGEQPAVGLQAIKH